MTQIGRPPYYGLAMILTNPFDDPSAVRARESQTDPLVMYLVVRRERVPSLDALLAAAAAATVRAERAYRADPAFAADFARWHLMSFRKVTLRANERDWPKLLAEYPAHALGSAGSEPIVAALPPRPRSSSGKMLRSLQAYTLGTSELPRAPLRLDQARATMLIAPNPAVLMSTGKLVAQAGHAALMCADAARNMGADEAWAQASARWQRDGLTVVPCFPVPAAWARAQRELDGAVVTDSGLTEVTPGSRTVLALRPAWGPELTAAAILLGGS